ncbi:hypothetical protein BgiMline_025431 [Biomphalaria glabrata]
MWEMVCGRWCLGEGIWEMVSGRRYLGDGIWEMVCGRWYVGDGIWEKVSERWYLRDGIWEMVSEKWYLRDGIWEMVSGRWYLKDGIWEMVSERWDPSHRYMGSKLAKLKQKSINQNQRTSQFSLHRSRCKSGVNSNSFIGDHETQESEAGEADLHKHFVNCKKNPGHRQFIPVNTFTLKHLPEGHQNKYLYELVKASADLTVRVSVKMTSPDRPRFWPQTTVPFPFSNERHASTSRVGSGRVWNIHVMQDGIAQDGNECDDSNRTECWCAKCEDSDSPSNVWWEFFLHTASHVVFDDYEAKHTTLRLFYDKDDSPVVIVDKVMVDYVNVDYDICVLKCVTCDESLGNRLTEMYDNHLIAWNLVLYKYTRTRDKHKMTFIVSHPHGCPKQISIGQWKDKEEIHDRTKFTYSTPTCPGSSGASVHCVGYSCMAWNSELVHSGCMKLGLNYSGAGRFP